MRGTSDNTPTGPNAKKVGLLNPPDASRRVCNPAVVPLPAFHRPSGYGYLEAVGGQWCRLATVSKDAPRPLQQFVELDRAPESDKSLLNFASWAEHLAIPVGHLAKGQAGEVLAALSQQQSKMAGHEIGPRCIGRCWP